MVLTLGATSAFGPVWASHLFGFLLWWLGPLAIHFHLHFPKSTPPHYMPHLKIAAYALAALGSLLEDSPIIRFDLLTLYTVRRLWLGIGFLSVVFLLLRAYRRAAPVEARQQVRLVSLGGVMALAPFLLLSLLPDALLHHPLLAYDISLLFLLALPLAYGYAILRYRLIHLERFISRGVAYVLVIMLLGSVYLIVYAVMAHLLPLELRQQLWVSLAITLLLAIALNPLHYHLQVVVNRIFYGGWYDYRLALQ